MVEDKNLWLQGEVVVILWFSRYCVVFIRGVWVVRQDVVVECEL